MKKFILLTTFAALGVGQISLLVWESFFLPLFVPVLTPVSLPPLPPETIELTWGVNSKSKIKTGEITREFYRAFLQQNSWIVDFEALEKKLKTLAKNIEQKPVNPRLVFNSQTQKWEKLTPAQSGIILNLERSLQQVAAGLAQGQASIGLILDKNWPALSQEKIKEENWKLLSEGESDFGGSSLNRQINIKLGAGKFQGLALAPGEEFSFNQTLGEVGAQVGYKAELVVKNQKLIPEYGGGLCQVSTTLFRAAIKAGLPITERRGHSLPVRYYNPQGFDATIYPGVVDLKFKNDTNSYLIIQNQVENTKLKFQIYGPDHGRSVIVEGPVVYEQTPAGALKTIFTRTITEINGETISEKFYTSYKSPLLFPTERNPLE